MEEFRHHVGIRLGQCSWGARIVLVSQTSQEVKDAQAAAE